MRLPELWCVLEAIGQLTKCVLEALARPIILKETWIGLSKMTSIETKLMIGA
jgi:hypothetical protein